VVQGGVTRDRDATGRPRNARPRDQLGRPLSRVPGADPRLDDPALPPAQALNHAQELLVAGEAFAAHEVLEAVWKATKGPQRALWRGLAQLCVGVTHSQRGNAAGARALLNRAADTLDDAPEGYGVAPATLARWARQAASAPTALTPPELVTGPRG
jgi:uncharacterized protein